MLFAALGCVVAAAVVFGVAFVYFATVFLIFIPLAAFSWSISGVRRETLHVAMTTGAAAAITATAPLWLSAALDPWESDPLRSAVSACYVVTAVIVGEAAGAVHAIREARRAVRRGTGRPRLTIAMLLASVVPLSILLALMQTAGLLRPTTAAALIVLAAVAAIAHRPVVVVVNCWADRRLRKRRAARST
ncbi:hypothetical protein [Botrimarina sp.]|uniref:hypothetical protein n=1 Tax=Botrimarina sp. TaxID=2795802 RepID=UPI0032EF043B